MFADWLFRLRSILRSQAVDRELDEELRFHLDQQVTTYIRSGMDPTAAARRARIEFGGLSQIKEETRQAHGVQWLDDALTDARFGLRTLFRDRGYAFAALVALGIGIGVNTALFTIFNAVVLRPLSVPDSDRVLSIYRATAQYSGGLFSYAEYLAIKDRTTTFSAVSANFPEHLRVTGLSPVGAVDGGGSLIGFAGPTRSAGSAEPAMGLFVSGNYFSMMGIRPVAGRLLTEDDDERSAPPYAALLSDNYWQRRLHRDGAVLGQSLIVLGIPITVVGIAPRDFMGTRPEVPDLFLPIAALQDPRRRAQDHTTRCCAIEARLKPGKTIQRAQAETAQINQATLAEHPDMDAHIRVVIEAAAPYGFNRHAYQRLFYVVLQPTIALVLLIACANVAGLLLGRAASRQRELAVRAALGAGRGRVVRQLLTEGVLLALLAAAVSLVLTSWLLDFGVRAFASALISSGLSDGGTLLLDVKPGWLVLLYTLSIAVVTGVAFALTPALQITRGDVAAALKDGSGVLGQGHSRARNWMVGTQVAVCLTLLIGAGVLVASSLRLLAIDPGFDPHHVLNVSIPDPAEIGYSPARIESLHRALRERLSALPGVASMTTASRVPLGSNAWRTSVMPIRDGLRNVESAEQFPYTFVSPEFFQTLRIPLERGRGFTATDVIGARPIVIVSEALARRLWPGEDAMGKHVAIGTHAAGQFQFQTVPRVADAEIVGIVRDVYSVSVAAPDQGAIYLPRPVGQWESSLLVRTDGSPQAVASSLIAAVHQLDPKLGVSYELLDATMRTNASYVLTRVGGLVFAALGAIGLVLASIGIYSMVGYAVTQQTREISIRMALGAQPRDVLRLVLGRTARPIGYGLAGGLALGLVLSLLLSALLEGLKLADPAVLAAVSIALGVIALGAAYLPARRALRLAPAITLRSE
jgi:predicted permease